VTVKLGPIVIGDDKQPHVGQAATVEHFDLSGNEEKRLVLPAPGEHFRVEVSVTPTFRPLPDTRDLGARVTYAYLPPRKAAHK
jgi:hypothetical protein